MEEKPFDLSARSLSTPPCRVISSVERGKARVSVSRRGTNAQQRNHFGNERAHTIRYTTGIPSCVSFIHRHVAFAYPLDNDRLLQVSIAKISLGFISVTSHRCLEWVIFDVVDLSWNYRGNFAWIDDGFLVERCWRWSWNSYANNTPSLIIEVKRERKIRNSNIWIIYRGC